MTLSYYLVFDTEDCIGRYKTQKPPVKPDGHDGEWNVEEVSESEAKSVSVNWFDQP